MGREGKRDSDIERKRGMKGGRERETVTERERER